MNDHQRLPQRRSPRLVDYDYSQDGAYFVTVCTQDRVCFFGEVVSDDIELSPAGEMIGHWWHRLAGKFPMIDLDLYVVMPNHIHGIVILHTTGGHTGPPLHQVMGWFKTMTTNHYIRGVKERNWQPFPGKLWQRSYYDHVIRNEHGLNHLRQYTVLNPSRWVEDQLYPSDPSS